VAGHDQGSATCIVAPDGALVASLDYCSSGVVAADIDLTRADRLLALRWAPERNVRIRDSGAGVVGVESLGGVLREANPAARE
jgi:hypothetical protein